MYLSLKLKKCVRDKLSGFSGYCLWGETGGHNLLGVSCGRGSGPPPLWFQRSNL